MSEGPFSMYGGSLVCYSGPLKNDGKPYAVVTCQPACLEGDCRTMNEIWQAREAEHAAELARLTKENADAIEAVNQDFRNAERAAGMEIDRLKQHVAHLLESRKNDSEYFTKAHKELNALGATGGPLSHRAKDMATELQGIHAELDAAGIPPGSAAARVKRLAEQNKTQAEWLRQITEMLEAAGVAFDGRFVRHVRTACSQLTQAREEIRRLEEKMDAGQRISDQCRAICESLGLVSGGFAERIGAMAAELTQARDDIKRLREEIRQWEKASESECKTYDDLHAICERAGFPKDALVPRVQTLANAYKDVEECTRAQAEEIRKLESYRDAMRADTTSIENTLVAVRAVNKRLESEARLIVQVCANNGIQAGNDARQTVVAMAESLHVLRDELSQLKSAKPKQPRAARGTYTDEAGEVHPVSGFVRDGKFWGHQFVFGGFLPIHAPANEQYSLTIDPPPPEPITDTDRAITNEIENLKAKLSHGEWARRTSQLLANHRVGRSQ